MNPDSMLSMLVISRNFPTRQLAWPGEFLIRIDRLLRHERIASTFLVPRPFTPWPLPMLARWRDYGPSNPLAPPAGVTAREARFVRPPGAWFFAYEGRTMGRALVKRARAIHRAHPIDLVLGVQMNGEAQAACMIGDALGLPVAALAIGTDVMVLPDSVPAFGRSLREVLARLDLPMAVSAPIARRMESLGACRRPPFVTRLAPDLDAFRVREDREALRASLGIGPDDLVATYVGRLEEPKGMADLCAALPGLLERHPGFKLICVGDGSLRAELARIGDAASPGSVLTPGSVAPDRVPDFLGAADLFVFPSHSEGLPQAVLEAMACGLPVVATNVGGTAEAVADGETGILIPARRPDAIAAAIERLLDAPSLRAKFGHAARERVRTRFDARRHAAALAAELRTAVERSRSGSTA